MRAITVRPGIPNSVRLEDVPEPPVADGSILARSLCLGVCATDREIITGEYGEAPAGSPYLILGHESFGVVEEAPADSGFSPGDHVVGVVRRPDPVPCPACAVGEWDMCQNGHYTERGIKARHGYGAERFRLEPGFAVKVAPSLGSLGVLTEPASIVAKAWDHIETIVKRSRSSKPRTLLVTGGGPVGLLAALMGVQRGLELFVLDRNTAGPKPELVRRLGGTPVDRLDDRIKPDIVMECTGAASVIRQLLGRTAPGGIVCLLGVSAPGHVTDVDIGLLNRTLVLNNDVILGAVNANRTHYAMAADALERADKDWLRRLITRQVPLARWAEAFEPRDADIKVVIDFTP